MADLISKEALLSELEERYENHKKRSRRNVGAGFVEYHKEWAAMATGIEECLAVVKNYPAVDAEPVKHGRWAFDEVEMEYFCSECGQNAPIGMSSYILHKYCPNCGARMEGVTK